MEKSTDPEARSDQNQTDPTMSVVIESSTNIEEIKTKEAEDDQNQDFDASSVIEEDKNEATATQQPEIHDEEQKRTTIIRSLLTHVKKNQNFQEIGEKFKSMNSQEQYDYFKTKIQKLETKVGATLGEALEVRVIKECLALFDPKTLSNEAVQNIMGRLQSNE